MGFHMMPVYAGPGVGGVLTSSVSPIIKALRDAQIEQLVDFVNTSVPKDAALILAGDLNLDVK